jgi:hypothetical protein
MTSLYPWLLFFHLAGLFVFLFAHGISGGASFALRGAITGSTRSLLMLSQRSALLSNPALLLILVTGVWMTFAGHFSGSVWPWAALVVLILVAAGMVLVARPYYMAREAAGGADDALAQRLGRTRPDLGVAIGGVGLLILLWLMVFKPF